MWWLFKKLFSSDIYGEISGLKPRISPVFTLTPLFPLTAAGGPRAPRSERSTFAADGEQKNVRDLCSSSDRQPLTSAACDLVRTADSESHFRRDPTAPADKRQTKVCVQPKGQFPSVHEPAVILSCRITAFEAPSDGSFRSYLPLDDSRLQIH